MLHLRSLLLYTFISLFFRSTLAATCAGIIGLVASGVSPLPEAQSFCSSKFPQVAITQTLAPSTNVVTSTLTVETKASPATTAATVATSTLTQIVSTDTITVTAPAVTVR